MSGRSHGYNMSVGYSHGFFREMAPDWLDLCIRLAGYDTPRQNGGTLRYLELGCGQGFGLCVLAAANPNIEFLGIDLQPDHIAHAQGLAQAAGLSNLRFVEADFVDLASRWPEEFGTFDYVALHGILSWVSAEVRQAVVECLRHATHATSVVYASYNAQPGWIATIPFQHFSRLIRQSTGKPAASVLEESTGLFDRLAAARIPIFQVLPALKPRVDAVKSRDENYFVHEYLHDSWHPLWHSEVAREFRGAELDFVATATMAESLLPTLLQPALRELIQGQPDGDVRQDLQDLVINQAFRRDIFCRSPRRRSSEDFEAAGETLLYLIASLEAGRSVTFDTAFGAVTLEYQSFAHIVEALANGPQSVERLIALPNPSEMTASRLLRLLLHANILGVGAAEPGPVEPSQRFNAVAARAVADGAPYKSVAAAMLGSGIQASDVDFLLMSTWLESSGKADVPALAKALAGGLAEAAGTQGARSLESLANTFKDITVPRYRQLGVVE